MRLAVFLILGLLMPGAQVWAGAPTYEPTIVAEYPHDPGTSTQGLFVHKDRLYESSGGYGESFLAIVHMETGKQLRRLPIEGKFFAEGIASHGDSFRLLTWMSGTGFVHSLSSLKAIGTFRYRRQDESTEGWGLTFGDGHFIMSTGKGVLRFHAPDDFALRRVVRIHDDGEEVRLLNELEFVGGMVLANVWKTDRICVIDPATGIVTAWISLDVLRKRIAPESGVANGIAYDSRTGALYVTGKNWDKLFRISVETTLWRQPVFFGNRADINP